MTTQPTYVLDLSVARMSDVAQVGGKNASLGEMIGHLTSLGVRVPGGFATTAEAFVEFLAQGGLADRIYQELKGLDVDDVSALWQAGTKIRRWIMEMDLPTQLEQSVRQAYTTLTENGEDAISFAVRSSATAEDLPEASFAGQQETFLNVSGIENILAAIKEVFASLFNDRAIAYRVHQNFPHDQVAISAGVQRMVRSDLATSGVMFSIDTESGFQDTVLLTGSYGLGEMVVQGAVNPDEFYVYKIGLTKNRPAILRRNIGEKAIKMIYADKNADEPVETVAVHPEDQRRFCITEEEVESLARQAMIIEAHYDCPMDIEWAKDGIDGKLYIVQARPETVQSRQSNVIESYSLLQHSEIIVEGRAISRRISNGTVRTLSGIHEMDKVQDGDILVTDMTDPDWEPIMKRAAAIVTNRGGRTCHAAIIARELGIPAIVGCQNATEVITDGSSVTVCCSEGDTGRVYEGILKFRRDEVEIDSMPEIPVKVMMNLGNPAAAFGFSTLPNHGVGLARLEFIINTMISVHPRALLEFDTLPGALADEIRGRIAGYSNSRSYFIRRLAEGISTLAAAFSPKRVIVRMSDFKSNEYANLLGGDRYEPDEENPMIGFRGASRYISENFHECFVMECEAIKWVRNNMGLTNVDIMIPFVRTLDEARQVIELLKENGLESGKDDLRIIMMCEIPSNALLAAAFLEYFDGFSIGSNDMTQLTLGLDRDSSLVASSFDERDPAVKALLAMAIEACLGAGKYIGICGQGPSDFPDFAEWLMNQGIESMSLNPDTVVATWLHLAATSGEATV